MKKGYKLFLLFLLMSMSVFANNVKITNVNQSKDQKVTLTIDVSGDKIDEIKNFYENGKEPLNLILQNKTTITYTSNLDLSLGDKVEISFDVIEYKKNGKQVITNARGIYYVDSVFLTNSQNDSGEDVEEDGTDHEKDGTDHEKDEEDGVTTLIIERWNGSFDIDLVLQNGGGNALILLPQDGKNFSILEDGKKIVIKFTGNKGQSMAVEENGKVTNSKISKSGDTLTYWYTYTGEELASLRFAIKNGGGSPSFEKGSGATDILSLSLHKNIEIKTYEEVSGGNVITLGFESNIYKFTKGGAGSYVRTPAIYVIVPTSGSNEEKITKLYFEKLDENGNVLIHKLLFLSGKTGDVKINYDFFGEEKYNFTEGAHIVQVTSTNGAGDTVIKKLNFVVDTQVNDSYLEDGIIGELDNDGKIKINLSMIKELSGIKAYSYTLKVGNKTKTGEKVSVSGKSYLEPSEDSDLGIVEILTSELKKGSRGTVLFTVYDKLGHEKRFEKTYFLPEKPTGIISKIEGEVKQRNSRIKIVTEGNKDKFGIGSNIEGSSE